MDGRGAAVTLLHYGLTLHSVAHIILEGLAFDGSSGVGDDAMQVSALLPGGVCMSSFVPGLLTLFLRMCKSKAGLTCMHTPL